MISKPIHVKAVSKYTIWLKFNDGTEGEIDLTHLIEKPVFQYWIKPDFFDKVYIDAETDAIAWNENIELCPDNMYLKIKGITFEQWEKSQNIYATNQ